MEIVGTALAEMTMPQISPLAGEPIERADAERLAGDLKALADPARLRLLSLIQSATDGEACVCDLTAPLGLSQPTVSHHLRILTEAGLLEREKRVSELELKALSLDERERFARDWHSAKARFVDDPSAAVPGGPLEEQSR